MVKTGDAELADVVALEEPPRRRVLIGALVATVFLLGLLLRLYILFRQPVNSDEAVVALMAHEILSGHFFAFYWGQDYGGGEAYVVAAVFGIFGQSSFTLGIVPVMLDACCAALVYRIGCRIFAPRVGLVAACCFWIWPEAYLWQSTLEYGFRWLALLASLFVVLFSLRIGDGLSSSGPSSSSRRIADWAGLGAAIGLGWWCSPEVVYYLVASGLYLAYRFVATRNRPRLSSLGALIVAAGIFALPWIWANVRSGLASFHHGIQPGSGLKHHLNIEQLHVLPIALGIERRISGQWLVGPLAGHVIEYVVVALGLFYLARLVLARRGLLLVAFLLTFPFIYAYSPFTWFWQDARYGIYLGPVLSLTLAGALDDLHAFVSRRSPGQGRIGFAPFGAGLVALLLALTLIGASNLSPYVTQKGIPARASLFSFERDPTGSLARLGTELESHGLHDLYAGYWVAYTLAFESRGAIVATDARLSYARYRPYLKEVHDAKGAGWLFVDPHGRARAEKLTGASLLDPGCAVKGDRCLVASELESYLNRVHISYRVVRVPDFEAVVPSRPVDAQVLLRRFRILAEPPS